MTSFIGYWLTRDQPRMKPTSRQNDGALHAAHDGVEPMRMFQAIDLLGPGAATLVLVQPAAAAKATRFSATWRIVSGSLAISPRRAPSGGFAASHASVGSLASSRQPFTMRRTLNR